MSLIGIYVYVIMIYMNKVMNEIGIRNLHPILGLNPSLWAGLSYFPGMLPPLSPFFPYISPSSSTFPLVL